MLFFLALGCCIEDVPLLVTLREIFSKTSLIMPASIAVLALLILVWGQVVRLARLHYCIVILILLFWFETTYWILLDIFTRLVITITAAHFSSETGHKMLRQMMCSCTISSSGGFWSIVPHTLCHHFPWHDELFFNDQLVAVSTVCLIFWFWESCFVWWASPLVPCSFRRLDSLVVRSIPMVFSIPSSSLVKGTSLTVSVSCGPDTLDMSLSQDRVGSLSISGASILRDISLM